MAAVVISTFLGLSTQGIVATTSSVIAGLSVLLGSGFSHAAAYAVARGRDSPRSIALWTAVAAGTLGLLVGAATSAIGGVALPGLPVAWSVVAVSLPLFQLGELGLGLHQGLGQNRWFLATLVAHPALLLLLSCLAAFTTRGSSPSREEWAGLLVVAPLAARTGVFVCSTLWIPGSFARFNLKAIFEYTARYYPTSVPHFLSYRLDLLLVGGLLGSVAAGTYSLAMNAVDAVSRIGLSASTVLYPKFATDEHTVARTQARRAAVSASVGAAILQLLAGVALFLVSVGRSEDLRTIGILVTVLAPGGGALCAWTILASFLAARGALGEVGRVSIVLLAVSVILYVTLIPAIGVYGGAVGTSVGLLFAAVLSFQSKSLDPRATAYPVSSGIRSEST